MSFRDIVVDACPKNDVHRTLEYAREMAAEFGAKLSVVSYAWPQTSVSDVLAGNVFSVQEQTRAMEDALRATRGAFDQVFESKPTEVEWCSAVGEPAGALRDHLFAADLLLTSSSEADACVSPDPADLALGTGTPVLRLGRTAVGCRFPNVLVAWKDCSHARHTVHDALPLLQRADSVTIVGVGDEVAAERLDAVAEHLRRHKVAARHLHIPHSQENICADLLVQAQREAASLIVAGVYSRGPLAEGILGGVTRGMLKNTELSWFMAH